MMRFVIAYFCFFTILTAAESIVVRSSVDVDEAWKGQRVQLTVEVLGKEGWAQIPNMPAMKVAGAYVLPPESQGVRAQEQIEGAAYSGQRYTLSVYPQKPGKITIPETQVSVSVSGTSQTVTIPAVSFTSKVPKGAENIDWLVSTSNFSATQSWSSEATELKVGDAIKRTITLSANDVSGMAFQPIEYPKVQGLGMYQAEPSVEDTLDRGVLSGSRTETVTYVFEGAGKAKIPDLEFVWWDVENNELKKVMLDERTFIVEGGPSVTYKEQSESVRSNRWWLVVLIALLAVLLWKRKWLTEMYLYWKTQQSLSEKVYFKQIAEAAQSGDVMKTQAAVFKWLDQINLNSESPAQIGSFVQKYSEKPHDISKLLENPKELYGVMVHARARWQQSHKKRKQAEKILPTLNG